jgi:hypothetical protein
VRAAWDTWVGWWRGEEHPRSLALVRILLGACVLFDFVEIARLGLVTALFVPNVAGGLSDATARATPPLFYAVFPPTVAAGHALHAALVLCAACFTLGWCTRTSAALLVLGWAQFADILPAGDRGIDTLCRDVLLLYVFAGGGRWASIDAWWSTGSWWGDGGLVPAWPRRLLMLQIVAMYFLAGVQKVGLHWWPMGHCAALYLVLQDPAIARYDFAWLARTPFFQITQVGTVVTLLFQDSYPVVLLLRWWKSTPERGGWGRRLVQRAPWLELVWIGLGLVFHLLLALTTELGIFPWAMLSLYSAWLHPDDWAGFAAWARGRLTGARAEPLPRT